MDAVVVERIIATQPRIAEWFPYRRALSHAETSIESVGCRPLFSLLRVITLAS